MRLTLSQAGVEGDYLVEEKTDQRLVLRRERRNADEVLAEHELEPASLADLETELGRPLPTDQEG